VESLDEFRSDVIVHRDLGAFHPGVFFLLEAPVTELRGNHDQEIKDLFLRCFSVPPEKFLDFGIRIVRADDVREELFTAIIFDGLLDLLPVHRMSGFMAEDERIRLFQR